MNWSSASGRTLASGLKFARRYSIHIVLAGMASLLFLALPTKVLSQANGPSMFFNYATMNLSLEQCKEAAYTKIATALEIAATMQTSGVIEASTNGVFGSGSGGHSAAVLCLPDSRVAVAVSAGPDQQRNNAITTYLLQGW